LIEMLYAFMDAENPKIDGSVATTLGNKPL